MTKAHETPFTPGHQATMTSRLAVALPGALVLLAESGIDIKVVLAHTKEGERLKHAVAMAIRALCDGHADTIPEALLEPIGIIDLPNVFSGTPASFMSRRDIEIVSNTGYADEFCRRLENADGPLPSKMVEAELAAESDDAAIVDYLGDGAFVLWRVIPTLLDSGKLLGDRYYVLYVRARGMRFSVSIWRDKARLVWRISPFPCGEGFLQKKGVIVLKKP